MKYKIKYIKISKNSLKDSLTIIVRVLAMAISFLFNILISRLYGASSVGGYYLVFNIVTIVSSIALLGFNYVLVKYLAPLYSKKSYERATEIMGISFLIVLIISVLFSVTLFTMAEPISFNIIKKPEFVDLIRLSSLSILPLALIAFYAELFKSIFKSTKSIMIQNVPIYLIMISIILIVNEYSLKSLVIIYVISLYIVLFYTFFRWKKYKTFDINFLHFYFYFKKIWSPENKSFFKENNLLFGVNLSNVILGIFDSLVVGSLLSVNSLGLYSISLRIVSIGSVFLVAINAILGAKFSTFWDKKKYKELNLLMIKTTKLTFFLATIFLVIVLLFAPFLLSVFGGEFTKGSNILRFLSIGQFIALATGPSAYFLIMTGNTFIYRKLTIISAIIFIVLNLILVKPFGIYGAVISNIAGLLIKNLGGFIFVKKRYRINFFIKDKDKFDCY